MHQVSVIIPVYNVEKYLRRCMDSLVGQTLRNIEIICVDDGSTDGSGAILDEYAAKDPRVKAIHQANAGAGPARNAGLDAAEGKYLFFCDPDDWCDRRMLVEMSARAERTEADLVFVSNYVCEGDNDAIVGRQRIPALPKGDVFAPAQVAGRVFQLFPHVPWNKLVRAEFVRRNGLRFQSLPRSNDAFFVEAALVLADRVTVLDRAFYYHRVRRPGSLMSASDRHPLTGYAARDALRELLKAHGRFDEFSVSWAFAVLSSAVRDLADFTSPDAFERSYAEIRRRLLEDPDMRAAVRHASFRGFVREAFELIMSEQDGRHFLLAALRDRKRKDWDARRRKWRLLGCLPEGALPLLRFLVRRFGA